MLLWCKPKAFRDILQIGNDGFYLTIVWGKFTSIGRDPLGSEVFEWCKHSKGPFFLPIRFYFARSLGNLTKPLLGKPSPRRSPLAHTRMDCRNHIPWGPERDKLLVCVIQGYSKNSKTLFILLSSSLRLSGQLILRAANSSWRLSRSFFTGDYASWRAKQPFSSCSQHVSPEGLMDWELTPELVPVSGHKVELISSGQEPQAPSTEPKAGTTIPKCKTTWKVAWIHTL